ncbi:acyltransferase family protein [Neomicrococcus lactis]|uniref:acyltransferase family protein n=1 Tax=Neomicrococcus lactis TaxID=732241 RepID=UPI00230118A4|nr:acyltransferase [Neomicrococcus lactis]
MKTGGVRLSGLDSLRGLAALIVVLSHALLLIPALGNAAITGHSTSPANISWWLAYTPLALMYSGGIAVYVFFILSGFVLSLPGSIHRLVDWAAYYSRRLIRLYLPVAGAVIFSVVLILLVPRVSDESMGWWMGVHAVEVYPLSAVREAVLLFGTGRYNTVLWSLVWEVVFSLFLPLYLLVGRWLANKLLLSTLGLIFLSALGMHLAISSLTYLPMFAIGVQLAAGVRMEDRRLSSVIHKWKRTLIFSLLILFIYFLLRDIPFALILCLMSCTGIVAACVGWQSENGVLNWLGTRSFSLYLVHEPILVTSAFLLGVSNLPWVWILGGLLVVLVTEVFYRLVESPSTVLSRTVGRTVRTILGSRKANVP